jgi:ubiquinone biosynthesis protein Coq4
MNLGDLIILKLAVLPRPRCEIGGAFPHLDMAALRKLPKKTLGGAYAEFLIENRITPLEPTRKGSAYALRFTATHDLHHVVTGFDTTLAGEIGVLAFNVAQGTVAIGSFGLGLAKILYSLVTPWNARRIFRNARLGRELGKSAENVLSAPLETWLEDGLRDVRARLKLPTSGQASVLEGSAAGPPASVPSDRS